MTTNTTTQAEQIRKLKDAARAAVRMLDALAAECVPKNGALARVFNRLSEEHGAAAVLSAAIADAPELVDPDNSVRMLELSTGHVSEECGYWLDGTPGFTVGLWGGYGWILYVESGEPDCTTVRDACTEAGYPELAAVLDFARSQGFAYVKLDADADYLPESCGLPAIR